MSGPATIVILNGRVIWFKQDKHDISIQYRNVLGAGELHSPALSLQRIRLLETELIEDGSGKAAGIDTHMVTFKAHNGHFLWPPVAQLSGNLLAKIGDACLPVLQ